MDRRTYLFGAALGGISGNPEFTSTKMLVPGRGDQELAELLDLALRITLAAEATLDHQREVDHLATLAKRERTATWGES